MRSKKASIALAVLFGLTAKAVAQQPPTKFPELKPKTDINGPVQTAANAESTNQQEEGEEDEGFQKKRDIWFTEQRAFPFTHIPAGARSQALMQHQLLKAQQTRSHTLLASRQGVRGGAALDAYAGLQWTSDGPSQLPGVGNSILYSGRATSLAIDPTAPQTMYLGTAGGGVWKTTDGGNSWTALTDSQPSLAIGTIVIDPNNTKNIFVGTGEPDYSGDSYYGQGLLKSSDGGATWMQIATPFTSSGSASPFAQLAIQPGNSSVMLAATQSGLYRSTDAGNNWSRIMTGYASAVIFDPVNTSTAYAGMNGYYSGSTAGAVFKTTNAGANWTSVSSGLPASNLVFRTALTMDSSGNLLAGIAPSSAGSGTIYKSTNGGTSWTALTATGDGVDWYRDWIAAVPGSPNVLYTGGVSLYQSTNGGTSWTKSSQSYATLLWADQHAAVFSPDGTKMYIMDDGGLFMTSSPASTDPTFVSLNHGIGSMTFYPGFAITGNASQYTLVGAQDHGTVLGTAGTQPWVYAGGGDVCGDGGPMVADAAGMYIYAHCQGSPLSLWMSSATGGAALGMGYPYGWVSAQSGIATSDRTAWVPPIATDPVNVTNLYTGTYRVYQSTNRASSWKAISGDLTGGSGTLNTMAIAPTDPNVVYTGASDGTVYVTNNALSGSSATWTKLTGLPARSIAKIAVGADSPQNVYVAVNGFGTGHIFHSTNGGSTWADLSGNLPNTPANSVVVDPAVLNTLYLATDTGVYVTNNAGATGGTTWEVLGTNLPNVVVTDIQLVGSSRLLRAVTHGRGAWDVTIPGNGFSASSNALSFGTQNAGTTSSVQTVTLANNSLSSVALSVSASSGYAQTNTCGASLASGANCVVSVTFTPSGAGVVSGTLTVISSQGTIPVSLTGTGITADATTTTVNTPSVTSATVGDPVTFTASVVDNASSGTSPVGNVTFTTTVGSSSYTLGTAAVASGTATLSTTAPYAGSNKITAAFNPSNSANFSASTDNMGKIVTVAKAALTPVAGYAPSMVQGTTVPLNLIIGYPGTVAPSGAITFTVNGSAAGLGTPTCVYKVMHFNCEYSYTSTLGPGQYTISFSQAADSNYTAVSGSNTLVVTPAPQTSLRPLAPVSTSQAAPGSSREIAPVPIPQP